MKLFITGAMGIGKTTIIKKIMERNPRAYYGFFSKRFSINNDGDYSVYLNDVKASEPVYELRNRVATCLPPDSFVSYPETFNGYGVQLLSGIPAGGTVIMDELGFMESRAEAFCRKVFEILNGPYEVLGVIKPKDIPFLNQIRVHRDVKVIEVTALNRNEVFVEIEKMMREKVR